MTASTALPLESGDGGKKLKSVPNCVCATPWLLKQPPITYVGVGTGCFSIRPTDTFI
jgi:hypothetical protein